MKTIGDHVVKYQARDRVLVSMLPSQVAPFKILARKVADVESVDKAAVLLGISGRVMRDLLYYNRLTDKQARTLLTRYKAWKDQRARLAA